MVVNYHLLYFHLNICINKLTKNFSTRTVTSSLSVFDKVNKHVTQVPHIECVYACACLAFSICLLADVHVYLFYIGTTVYACKCVCVVVGVGARVVGCVCVCV